MGRSRLTPAPAMRVLVTGADGQLGRDVLDALAGRVPAGGRRCSLLAPEGPLPGLDYEVLATDIGTMRVDDRDAVQYLFHAFRPDLVLHCGAITAVDACETEVDLAYAVNAIGTRNVAEAAGGRRRPPALRLDRLRLRRDVGRGRTGSGTRTNPLSVYGASKLAGERECPPGSTIVRTSWVCGAHGSNIVKTALRLAEGEGILRFVDDQQGSPTFTADLAAAIVTLGHRQAPGHLPRDQQRDHDLVGLGPGHPGGGRPGSRAGARHLPQPSSTHPARPPARPTRCSTTWPCA